MKKLLGIISILFISIAFMLVFSLEKSERYFLIGYTFDNGKSHTQAIKWYLKASELNNAWANYNLGVLYLNGVGVPKDSTKAIHFFQLASKYGKLSSSEINLGLIYYRGIGVEKNDNLAFEWIKISAEHGDTDAQLLLAQMYQNGEGVVCDPIEANAWLAVSADGGNSKAKAFKEKNDSVLCKEDLNKINELAKMHKTNIAKNNSLGCSSWLCNSLSTKI